MFECDVRALNVHWKNSLPKAIALGLITLIGSMVFSYFESENVIKVKIPKDDVLKAMKNLTEA